jgi:hypothetical protein
MPYDQGWSIEAQTLRRGGPGENDCPLMPVDLGAWEFECYWYGGVDGDQNGLHDNDGTVLGDPSPVGTSGGGYLDASDSPTSGTDHNRMTTNPDDLFEGYYVNYVWEGHTTWKATESYSEWMEFDNGDDDLEHVATLGQHPRTPKGASEFPGAPSHEVLRLVGGDGIGVLNSLPFVASFNNQDGQALLRKSYETMGITGTITVVFRGALSVTQEGEANHAFLLVRAYDPAADKTVYFAFTWFMPRTFSGGVPICDADPPSGDCGKFGVINLQNGDSAQACVGQDGRDFDQPLLDGSGGGPDIGRVMPHEFFTFRVICDPSNDGSAQIFLNEDTPTPASGTVTNTTYGPDFKWGCKNGIGGDDRRMIKVGLRHEDDTTMWIDYVKVYQGAVEPPEIGPCTFASDPVFDVTGSTPDVADGKVDEQDLDVFSTECYTGPAPPVGAFDALSQRCQCMDLNADEAIDHEDFGRFQACYTGDDGILDESCDD